MLLCWPRPHSVSGEQVLVTTSRDPSTRLTQFAKEMKLVIPSAQRLNRGGQVSLAQLELQLIGISLGGMCGQNGAR